LNQKAIWNEITTIKGSNLNSYIWTVPNVEIFMNKCKVKVELRDASGNILGQDESDNYFMIKEPVKVTSPNGGETLTSDATRTITWTTNATGNILGQDASNGYCIIEGPVKVTLPNGGETLTSGDIHTITWATNTTKRLIEKVKLYYTKNGGSTWKLIEEITGDSESYDWTVPRAKKTKRRCKVKVVLKDARGRTLGIDKSDSNFTIHP